MVEDQGAFSLLMSKNVRIALTGGIATGKTTVLHMFSNLGYSTVVSDDVAREVMQEVDWREIFFDRTGNRLPEKQGELREYFFKNWQERHLLNEIVHPLVMERLFEREAQVFEVPVLFESCLHEHFEVVICVTCPKEMQISRLRERGLDEGVIDKILGSQLDSCVKVILSDFVLRTDCDISTVHTSVNRIASCICV